MIFLRILLVAAVYLCIGLISMPLVSGDMEAATTAAEIFGPVIAVAAVVLFVTRTRKVKQ